MDWAIPMDSNENGRDIEDLFCTVFDILDDLQSRLLSSVDPFMSLFVSYCWNALLRLFL